MNGPTLDFPVPANEAGRLTALESYGVVGAPPELDFDEIASLAGAICGCPVAVVNIVADRWEWYKGKCGVPEHANREPRGGICSTTICMSDLLIVPDLTKDDRFADQETVKDKPFFRFYAGAPLINPEGFALGSLCVLDYVPRDLDAAKMEALRYLSHQAVAQLELRRRIADLEQASGALAAEKRNSDRLLFNILPPQVAEELKSQGKVQPRFHDHVTILMTDFQGFTRLAEEMEPRRLIEELDEHFSAFDDIVARHGLEKLKTIGDAHMSVGGLPTRSPSHPLDACAAALDIRDYMARDNDARAKQGLPRWGIRIGLHSGGVIAGVVGKSKFTYDIWGDAVNVTALMEASADDGQIVLSDATYRVVRDHFDASFLRDIQTPKKAPMRCYALHGRKT